MLFELRQHHGFLVESVLCCKFSDISVRIPLYTSSNSTSSLLLVVPFLLVTLLLPFFQPSGHPLRHLSAPPQQPLLSDPSPARLGRPSPPIPTLSAPPHPPSAALPLGRAVRLGAVRCSVGELPRECLGAPISPRSGHPHPPSEAVSRLVGWLVS